MVSSAGYPVDNLLACDTGAYLYVFATAASLLHLPHLELWCVSSRYCPNL